MPAPDREKLLFDAALDLPDAAARSAFLDRECGSDAALRARLSRLLSAHATADAFLAPPAPAGTPARIGRYQLVRRLGEGGCGVVYLAEQQEPVRRLVALKIIRLGMDTERAVARFELERQALALLNHPGVAQVLDAGSTDSGRPYFVMELVEGEPITACCDRLRLDVRARLGLFIQVCHAIQHAHQKGVLHRDIKPSNILVSTSGGASPAPKVVDFGVAKAFAPDAPASDAATFADGEQFLGTPAYMSPEQAAPGRAAVDTRSDIYSLGALLHELLVGRPPFDSRELLASGLDQLRLTLREVEPPRPSRLLRSLPPAELASLAALRRAEPRALVSTLRRDLDWIVARALEKDPARRYPTANGLALDVSRYLRDDPVEARPPARAYRLRKLVRRHRAVFAAVTAVALALLGGLAASTTLYLREREALRQQTLLRHRAETAEQLTRAVFLTREGAYEAAARVLDAIPRPLAASSFDGVVAFRSVGDWLASRRLWAEAAERFRVALDLGRLDTWEPVTLDHQSCGVSLLLAGDEAAYARFRSDSVARFHPAHDSDAVARVLKTCLLRPLDSPLRERLLPLGARVEFWFSGLHPRLSEGWALVPVTLWRYRLGNYTDARRLALRGLAPDAPHDARTATLRLLLALSEARLGNSADARRHLDQASAVILPAFAADLSKGDGRTGYWYDWAFARLLLAEAETTLGP